MASAGSPLDAGPPLPPGLSPGSGGQPTPKPSLDQMTKGQKPEGQPGSPQEAAIQQLIAAEAAMDSAANIVPGLLPLVADIKNQMHARFGKVLMSTAQAQPTSGSMMGAPAPSAPAGGPAMGGGLMASPAMPPGMAAT